MLFQECFWGPLQKAETNTQPSTCIRLEDCCFDMNHTHLAEMRYCKKEKKNHISFSSSNCFSFPFVLTLTAEKSGQTKWLLLSCPCFPPLPRLWCPLCPCSLTTNKQSKLFTLFQLWAYSNTSYPCIGLLAQQKRRRKGSKLERAAPKGIILVLWHTEGQLFASWIVTSGAWESERKETDYSD